MYNKFKYLIFDDRWTFMILLILVAGIAFGLGRLSTGTVPYLIAGAGVSPAATGVKMILQPVLTDDSLTIPWEAVTAQSVIASRNGSRYYPYHCTQWERINPENRLVFVDAVRARAAGYTRAAGCD